MAREKNQRGWLRTERRRDGRTWLLHYRTAQEPDGKRVEHKIAVGLVRDLPSKQHAWAEVGRQNLQFFINRPHSRGMVTFGELARHYEKNELGDDQEQTVNPKSHTTIAAYRRIIRNRLVDQWAKRSALSIEPLEIERWLTELRKREKLEHPTMDKIRRVMNLVYKHGQRYGLIPRGEESNPLRFVRCRTTSRYEALILSPQQAFNLLVRLPDPERTLTLLAAGTGLRISECLGLQWQDVNFAGSLIHVRRTWTCGQVGHPKSKASQAPVPLHPLLAEFLRDWKKQTLYGGPEDWVFASTKLRGRKPRVANMLVEDHVRPAAVEAGVLKQDEERRFGFHNLRH